MKNLYQNRIVWKEQKYINEWADKAMCYSWLHSKSYNLYKLTLVYCTSNYSIYHNRDS